MSVPIIAFFNNKGGVGKTTLVYHLAWMYHDLGRRVLAADLDPQANLTAAFLDDERLARLWPEGEHPDTISGAVAPLTRGLGDVRDPPHVELVGGDWQGELGLIPGDLRLAEFEDDLAQEWPRCLAGQERAFRVTSAFWRAIQAAAHARSAEFVLLDLGPNLGAINRAALIASDFLVIPMVPDLFSLIGLENLGPRVKMWRRDWQQRRDQAAAVSFALPSAAMRPIGYIVMQHAERLSRPVRAYEHWANQIPEVYANQMQDGNMLQNGLLANVKHYRSLIPMAQSAQKPVFHLKAADGAMGSHAQLVQQARESFEVLANEILRRCGIATSVIA